MKKQIRFKNRMKRARFEAKKTQPEVSLRTGISITKISLLENGLKQPTLEEKRKLSRALDCDIAWIFPEKEKIV